MTIRSKAIATKHLTLGIASTLSLATILGVGIYSATNIVNTNNVNALSYSTNEDISFTFKPTLSISLSTGALTIDNLVPGTTSDSNAVTVTVASNTPYGYVLSAGVGSTVSTDPYYNTSDLVHDNSTTQVPTTNKFSSIATSASLETLDTDNTWGYSTSTNGGTSWSTYSGLSHAETKPLLDISDPAAPSTIDFKIAARSASTQASGTYNNVITFYAVGKPEPVYMQEPEVIKAKLKNVGDELQAIDQRDGKKYWVARLADGNVWMTQNLDLCIGCEGTSALTSQNTDLNASGSGAYSSGYTNTNGIITWSPSSTARTSRTTINGDTVSPEFANGSAAYYPYSAEGNDIYVYTSDSTDDDAVYGSLASCANAGHSADICSHYHVGNYYNWAAVVASSNAGSFFYSQNQYTVAANSICPAGWRLPKGRAGSESTAINLEFSQLLYVSNITTSFVDSYYAYYTKNGFKDIRTAPLYFVRGGTIGRSAMFSRATAGNYWSSTTADRYGSYSFSFSSNNMAPSSASNYMYGKTARCLLRQ